MTKSLISINDLTKEDFLRILQLASQFEEHGGRKLLKEKVIASLFFEASTRTRLSFESAIYRLGGQIIGFTDSSTSSVSKGESFHDTILMIAHYADMIVMRHPLEGSARYAASITSIPIINAGDGAHQHPTQTLLDLYSIQKTQKRLDNLKVAMVGDLKYGRTIHSLLMALSRFENVAFHFVSPAELAIPEEYRTILREQNIQFSEHRDFQEIIPEVDILYMTRVQGERFSDLMEYEKVKDCYSLRPEMLKNAKDTMKILHPLPRLEEIHPSVDKLPHAYYFTQACNGVYARQATIAHLLNLL